VNPWGGSADKAEVNSATSDLRRGRLLVICDPGQAGGACAPLRCTGHLVDAIDPAADPVAAAAAGYDVVIALAPRDVCARIIAALRADPRAGSRYVIAGGSECAAAPFGPLADADDILAAPFDPAELRFRVERGLAVVEQREELAAARRALREGAMSDPVTGLPNRRTIERMVVAEAARVSRGGGAACVVCADLDGFREVNDRHGQTIGDLILVAFAGAIRANLRTQDEFGRMTGGEFVILMRGATLDAAIDACGRLRDAVSAVRVPAGRGELALSASFGIAPIRPGDDPGQVLDVADCALYAARSAGGSRIETATESLA
jgi:diguanylate cyclase (GGDEF)-like protein